MENIVRNYGLWFVKCCAVGSIPGAVCWSVFFYLGGIVA